ncbi:protein of unknown function [Trichlorobacter ammonificans]|uniref:Uncharacterized protein n=1 Tax=Trichlorobacter ammonificans TaxID=2916410 RepID=A0ABM9DD25_9BACT|nr:protein of unknown function [Trichlorobacter ammonificans]
MLKPFFNRAIILKNGFIWVVKYGTTCAGLESAGGRAEKASRHWGAYRSASGVSPAQVPSRS